MGEKAVFAIHAHVFQIDPETKKKWLPSSTASVRVAYYHDPSRKTYRIIAIENNKALVNSTITANMNFTKTSPKFGQWSDHRANTVFGLGFSSERDLNQFVEKFDEAKESAKLLLEERKIAAKKELEQDKPQPPADTPISPPNKSLIQSPPPPPIVSPEAIRGQEEQKINGSEPSFEKSQIKVNGAHAESSPLLGRSTSALSTLSPEAQVEALKYENSKLKVALASSAQNVKKWESEMQTLKNNNTRLTTALEESGQHVTEWKKQLQKYKEESDLLKAKVQDMEAAKRELSSQASEEAESLRRENEELKDVLSAVQLDLEAKTEELLNKESEMQSLLQQVEEASSKLQSVEDDRQSLFGQVAMLEDQLKMASVATKRRLSDVQLKHKKLGDRLEEVLQLHREVDGHFDI